jgi:hypothetical protein
VPLDSLMAESRISLLLEIEEKPEVGLSGNERSMAPTALSSTAALYQSHLPVKCIVKLR